MIIISGASRGIGQFLLHKFIGEGTPVIGLYNNTVPSNPEHTYKVDITNHASIAAFIAETDGLLSELTLLNCAGANYNAFAHKADPSKWAELININLVGTFNMINALLPIMREQNFGRIINFSSIVAQIGIAGTSAYAASKAGLWGMSKAIAVENASKGITINNLNLGYFNIGMITDVPPAIQETIKDKIPNKKFGDPDEIFRIIKFLNVSAYTTGTSIDINGGLY